MTKPLDFLRAPALADMIELHTDCPVWPYLAYYIQQSKQAFKEIDGLSDKDKSTIINGFLCNLASRITAASNNVLFTERDILEKTVPLGKITVREHYEIIKKQHLIC